MVLCCGSCCLVVVGKSAVDLELVPVTTRNSAAAAGDGAGGGWRCW